nr:K536 [uncultured bacterium]
MWIAQRQSHRPIRGGGIGDPSLGDLAAGGLAGSRPLPALRALRSWVLSAAAGGRGRGGQRQAAPPGIASRARSGTIGQPFIGLRWLNLPAVAATPRHQEHRLIFHSPFTLTTDRPASGLAGRLLHTGLHHACR